MIIGLADSSTDVYERDSLMWWIAEYGEAQYNVGFLMSSHEKNAEKIRIAGKRVNTASQEVFSRLNDVERALHAARP